MQVLACWTDSSMLISIHQRLKQPRAHNAAHKSALSIPHTSLVCSRQHTFHLLDKIKSSHYIHLLRRFDRQEVMINDSNSGTLRGIPIQFGVTC